tara:strand:- start:2161 stop:2346 length:186 start_codon:yes stop_codon:yes gene_type:complete
MINNIFILDDDLIVVELLMFMNNNINKENFIKPIDMMFYDKYNPCKKMATICIYCFINLVL